MRPTLLELDGILSYRSYQSIDFTNIEFAAIVGDNGAGKSSIFDAILFALFGSVASGNLDMILSTGVDEGTVSFEFTFDEYLWRITRTRTRGKKTTAQLFKWDPEKSDWEIIVEGSVRAVDLEIQRLLRVDEAAFRSTVLLSQNEAGAFSSATPADRKNILSKIIGLDRYSKLSSMAKAKATEAKNSIATSQALAEQIEKRIQEKPVLEIELQRILESLTEKEKQFEENEALAQEADDSRQKRVSAIEALRTAISTRKETLIEQTRDIEEAYNRAVEDLDEKKYSFSQMKDEKQKKEKEAEGFEKNNARVSEIAQLVVGLEEEENTIVSQGQKEAEKYTKLQNDLTALETEKSFLVDRLGGLSEDGRPDGECWVCGNPLDEHKKEKILQETQEQINSLDAKIFEAQKKSSQQNEHIESLRKNLKENKGQQKILRDESSTLQDIIKRQQSSLQSVETLEKQMLEKEQQIIKLTETISDLNEKRFSIDDDEQLAEANKKLKEAEEKLQSFSGGGAFRAAAAQAAAAIRTLSNQQAVIESKLEKIEEENQEYNAINEKLSELVSLYNRHTFLAKAFGKDGIPNLIYAGVVSELNDHINDILNNLSDGSFSVQLVTTKPTQKGTLSETLEVMIDAPDGSRPYASFSGGEKFRIDISIRLGLSRLLANRNGARMDFLAIDEGWGALDPQGIASMMSELNKLRSEFSLILTVTHIDSIREGFGTLVNVEKTPAGSVVKILN